MQRRTLLRITLAAPAALAAGCTTSGRSASPPATHSPTARGAGSPPARPGSTAGPAAAGPRITAVLAHGLAVPWGIAFLPGGGALVGERDRARIVLVQPHGGYRVVGKVPGVVSTEPLHDGWLYVSTGDAEQSSLAQDKHSLNGKILRITPTGGVPRGNQFGNPVWSYGHRNVEGLALDGQGRMRASELGSSVHDELDRIVRGGDYG